MQSGCRSPYLTKTKIGVGLLCALVSILTVTLTPPAVQAQGAAAGGEQQQGDPLAIYRAAGVTPDQESQIRQMAKEFEDVNAVRLQTMLNLLREMRAISLKPEPDEKAVLGKQSEINTIESEMSTERVKLLLKIRSTLTHDQRVKLVSLMQAETDNLPQASK